MKKIIAITAGLLVSVVAYAATFNTIDEFAVMLQFKPHVYDATNGTVAEHFGKEFTLIKIANEFCLAVDTGGALDKIKANAGTDGWTQGSSLLSTLNIPSREIGPHCWDYTTVAYGSSASGLYYDSVNDVFMSGAISQGCGGAVLDWPSGWFHLASDPNLYAVCDVTQ